MTRGGGFICEYNFIIEDFFLSKDQERHHNSKVGSEEELKENQRWARRGKPADRGRHNEQEQERGVKHSSNAGEMGEVWHGKGNRRTEGAGSKRKTAGQRLRGQNLEHIRAECIFFISLLTGTYTVGMGWGGEREGGREGGQGRRADPEEEAWGQAVWKAPWRRGRRPEEVGNEEALISEAHSSGY